MDWEATTLALVLFLVSLSALVEAIRRGGRQRWDIGIGTIPLATIYTAPLFVLPQQAGWALLVVIVAAPMVFLRMVHHLRPVSLAIPLAVFLMAGFAITLPVAWPATPSGFTLAMLAGAIASPYIIAAVLTTLAAQGRHGVSQRRLVWTTANALATALLLVMGFVQYGQETSFGAAIFVESAFAITFTMAFATPRLVREQWRALEFRRFVEATRDDPDEDLTSRLEAMRNAAASVVEAEAVFILEEDEDQALCVTHDEPFPGDAEEAWELLESAGDTIHEQRGWKVLGLQATGQPRRAMVVRLSGNRLFPGEDDEMLDVLAAEIRSRFREAAFRHVEKEGRLAAEELARFRSEFLRAVAHEIANPLSPIKMQLSILRRDYEKEAPRPFNRIDRSLERIEALMRDISTISRLGTAGMQLGVEDVDLSNEVQSAVDAYVDIGRESDCEVKADVESGVVLPADGLRIRQVIDNLLSNAIKYSPDGGRVNVQLRKRGGLAELHIKDEGLGMDADQLARLFSTYGRVHTDVAPGIQGTGMGLYIARQLARMHGGDLMAHSEGPGQGTRFSMSLPLEGPPEDVRIDDRPPMPGVKIG